MEGTGVIAEGSVKFRERKRWKERWCVLKKISPVADCLHIYLYKDGKDRTELGKPICVKSMILTNYVGLESRLSVYKEKHVLCLISLKQIFMLAFTSREVMNEWEKQIKLHQGKDLSYHIQLLRAPLSCRIPTNRDLRLYIRGSHITVTGVVPSRIIKVWRIQDIQRFGAINEKLVLEAGREKDIFVFDCEYCQEVISSLKAFSQSSLALSHRRAAKRWSRLSLPVQLCLHSSSEERLSAPNSDGSRKDFQNRQVYADVNFKVYSENNASYYYQEPYDAESNSIKRRKSADDILNDFNTTTMTVEPAHRNIDMFSEANKIMLPHKLTRTEKKASLRKKVSMQKNKSGAQLSQMPFQSQENRHLHSGLESQPQENSQKQNDTVGVNILNSLLRDLGLNQTHYKSRTRSDDAHNNDTVFATVELSPSQSGTPHGSMLDVTCIPSRDHVSDSSCRPSYSSQPQSRDRSASETTCDDLLEEVTFPTRKGSSSSEGSQIRQSLRDIRLGSIGQKSLAEESNQPLHFVDLSRYDGLDSRNVSKSYNTIVLNTNCSTNAKRFNMAETGAKPSNTAPGVTVISAKGYVNSVDDVFVKKTKSLSQTRKDVPSLSVASRQSIDETNISDLPPCTLNIPGKHSNTDYVNIPPPMNNSHTSAQPHQSGYMEMQIGSNQSHHHRSNTISSLPFKQKRNKSPMDTGRSGSVKNKTHRVANATHHLDQCVHVRAHSDTLDGSENYLHMTAASSPERKSKTDPMGSLSQGKIRDQEYVLMDSKTQKLLGKRVNENPAVDNDNIHVDHYMMMEFGPKTNTTQPPFGQWSRSKSVVEHRKPDGIRHFHSKSMDGGYPHRPLLQKKRSTNSPKRPPPVATLRTISIESPKKSPIHKKSPIGRLHYEELQSQDSSGKSDSEIISETDGQYTSNKTDSDSSSSSRRVSRVGIEGERTVAIPFDNLIPHTHHSAMDNKIREEDKSENHDLEKDDEITSISEVQQSTSSKGGSFFKKLMRRRGSISENSLLRKKSSKKRKSIKVDADETLLSSQEDILDGAMSAIDKRRNTYASSMYTSQYRCASELGKPSPDGDCGEYFDMATKERQRSASVPGKEWLNSDLKLSTTTTTTTTDSSESCELLDKPFAVVPPFVPYNTPENGGINRTKTPPSVIQECELTLESYKCHPLLSIPDIQLPFPKSSDAKTVHRLLVSSNDSLNEGHSLNEALSDITGSQELNTSDLSVDIQHSYNQNHIGSNNEAFTIPAVSVVDQSSCESNNTVFSNKSETIERNRELTLDRKSPSLHICDYSMVCYEASSTSTNDLKPDVCLPESNTFTKDSSLPRLPKNTGAVVIDYREELTENSGTSTQSAITIANINGTRVGSLARTTMRPRSGKEYQLINRRLLSDENIRKSGTSTSLPTSPNQIFNSNRRCISQSDEPVTYMNIDTTSAKVMYMNINLTNPESFRMEQYNPILNYAEIDLSGNVNPNLTSSHMTKRSNCPTEYAVIDVVATENAQKAAKEHAETREQPRHESLSDTLRREGPTKDRKGSSSSAILTRDRMPSANSTGSET